jgi:ubiquinone/menaquinone biosynthesis C-methylase UbiE
MKFFKRRPVDHPPDPEEKTVRRPDARRPATLTNADDDPDWRSYDRIAERYAAIQAPRTALVAADLVELTGVREGQRVLDVGTGTGVTARAAATAVGAGGVAVGIDPSPPMLRFGLVEGGGVRYAAAEAIDLPFADGTFDAVVSSFAITHFQKYDTALFDMIRVLRTGGRFGVATWGQSQDEFSRAWDEVAESFAGVEILRDVYARAMPWADRFSDPKRLKETLYDAGIRGARVETREYRFEMTAQDYLESREIAAPGRFLNQTLGDHLWERFRERTRQVFAERFPPVFNDFRDVILAAGNKP